MLDRILRRSDPILERFANNLEALGKWERAQKIRLFACDRRGIANSLITLLISLIEADIHIQEIVQRETFLKEECQQLSDKLSKEKLHTENDEDQRRRWLSELEDLNKEYWQKDIEKYSLDLQFRVSPMSRAFWSTVAIRNGTFMASSGWTAQGEGVAVDVAVAAVKDRGPRLGKCDSDIALWLVDVASGSGDLKLAAVQQSTRAIKKVEFAQSSSPRFAVLDIA